MAPIALRSPYGIHDVADPGSNRHRAGADPCCGLRPRSRGRCCRYYGSMSAGLALGHNWGPPGCPSRHEQCLGVCCGQGLEQLARRVGVAPGVEKAVDDNDGAGHERWNRMRIEVGRVLRPAIIPVNIYRILMLPCRFRHSQALCSLSPKDAPHPRRRCECFAAGPSCRCGELEELTLRVHQLDRSQQSATN